MKEKIKEIIGKMTLEEKAGMCSGQDTWRLKSVDRLGIPTVMVADGPHGLRKQEAKGDNLGIYDSIKAVCFPAGCAVAASFDKELLEFMGGLLGEECRAEGVSVLLGPAINIKRSPLCGRNFEYLSEDPLLAGILAAAYVKGVQKHEVGTSPKHYAANNQEHRRMTSSSEMNERTLREIYLTAFETVVKESKPWTVMSSYNKINGEYVGESYRLLTDILRNEWGFDGFVVSDWGAVDLRVQALKAGLDLEMPYSDGSGDRDLIEAVKNGKLDEAVLDKAVERILNIIFRYADARGKDAEFDCEKHHGYAAHIAKKCAVLLKNENLLPLSRKSKVAYIGPYAQKPRFQGGGSSHINAHKVVGAYEAASNTPAYAQGFAADGKPLSEEEIKLAVETAKNADVAVIFAGLPDSYETEGYDRSHMRLPDSQNELIAKIAEVQPNTAVVLHLGSPVEMPWIDKVAAVLNMYLGGEGCGEAADALIYGDANPSGRLPETFPLRLEDTPCYLDFPGDEKVYYSEGTHVGYRYYDAKNMEVLFPFGHGLSYTDFEYSDLEFSADKISDGEKITVSVQVKNTGNFEGEETVQIYTDSAQNKYRRLAGFKKQNIKPGETKTFEIELDMRAFEEFDERLSDWFCEKDVYTVYAAHSSRDIRLEKQIKINTTKTFNLNVNRNTTLGQLLDHPATKEATSALLAKMGAAVSKGEEVSEEVRQMLRGMALSLPLRSLPSLGFASREQIDGLTAQMKALEEKFMQKENK
ncbi:MAG TPA: glycoside hydrolase family 3 C-terminal domain-containing protein [Clostridiales bacterium]|nr:glycoside hydrolase family 3 C-terminal domain-containing protein [Clostridiales bacterium]